MKINRFIEPIVLKKKKHSFKSWIKKKLLIRRCNKLSPSFNQMCEIYEFLKILRNSYMYSNDKQFHLFIGTIPKGRNGSNTCSMFYKEDEKFSIGFILFKDTKTINIEIDRKGQIIKSQKEYIEFTDGEYEFKDVYDKEKMLFITSCLMNGVVELIDYYYKNKKI